MLVVNDELNSMRSKIQHTRSVPRAAAVFNQPGPECLQFSGKTKSG